MDFLHLPTDIVKELILQMDSVTFVNFTKTCKTLREYRHNKELYLAWIEINKGLPEAFDRAMELGHDAFILAAIPKLAQNKLREALEIFVTGGKTEHVIAILAGPYDINVNDLLPKSKVSPLLHATSAETITALLALPEIDVHVKDTRQRTLLHRASALGHVDIVRMLLQVANVNVNDLDCHHNTPLHLASAHGHAAIVRVLGTAPNIQCNKRDLHGVSALHLARNAEVVRALFELSGLKANTVDKIMSHTPLQRSIWVGNHEVVEELKKTPGVDIKDVTPIHQAVVKNREKNEDDGQSPLHTAVRKNDAAALRVLLECLDVNVRDSQDMTPLHLATKLNATACIQVLIVSSGIDLNILDASGSSALYHAVKKCDVGTVKMLLEAPGIDVNAHKDGTDTPLHNLLKCTNRGAELAPFFLAAPGIDVTICDWKGRTVADIFAATYHNKHSAYTSVMLL